jgi:hypothetical protein
MDFSWNMKKLKNKVLRRIESGRDEISETHGISGDAPDDRGIWEIPER